MASTAPTIRLRPLPDAGCSPAEELLACAETLGIPWRRVLAQEIEAEQRLRTYLPDVGSDCPWETALEILSTGAAQSWRVRDQLETLAWEARASVRGAERKLRDFVRSVSGARRPDPTGARQNAAAYDRILLLQRARRAAARSRGTEAERLAFVCVMASCKFEDAAWALALLETDAPRRGRRMEAAVRKARAEGFFVPREATEARSLAQLRRMVFGFRDERPRKRGARAS
jgi:hypothetical protein